MKIGRQDQRSSAISTSNPRHDPGTRPRSGRGADRPHQFHRTFLAAADRSLPSPPQRRVLDATLVAIAEHGLVPSVQASRMTLAAAPEALQGAVAAGILGCGSVVLGSAEAAGRLFAEIATQAAGGAAIDAAATKVISELPRRRSRHPRLRAPACTRKAIRARSACSQVAREAGIVRPSCRNRAGSGAAAAGAGRPPAGAECLGRHSRRAAGCRLSAAALKGVPMLARTAGLVAHLLEEQQRPIGFVMSHAAGRSHRLRRRGARRDSWLATMLRRPQRLRTVAHDRHAGRHPHPRAGDLHHRSVRRNDARRPRRRRHQGRESRGRSVSHLSGRPVLPALPGLQPQQAQPGAEHEARAATARCSNAGPRGGRLHPELPARHCRAPRRRRRTAAGDSIRAWSTARSAASVPAARTSTGPATTRWPRR